MKTKKHSWFVQFLLIVVLMLTAFSADIIQSQEDTSCTLPPRLTVGQKGRVLPGLPNRIRVRPSVNGTQLNEIPSGGVFTVLEGPVCADGYHWWRIDYKGNTGWTAEGDDSIYWLVPVTSERPPITVENASRIELINYMGRGPIGKVSWTSDDNLLVFGLFNTWIYDPRHLEAPPAKPSEDQLPSDASALLRAEIDGFNIRILNTSTGHELSVLKGHTDQIADVTFSPDFALVASASYDVTVRLWDSTTGIELKLWQGTAPARFSSDGSILAFGGWDPDKGSRVQVWQIDKFTRTYTEIATLDSQGGGLQDIAFSPNGKLLVSSSWNFWGEASNAIRVWDIATATEVSVVLEDPQDIWMVAFNSDGSLLAGGSSDGAIRIWNVWTGELVSEMPGTSFIDYVAFSPKGDTLVSVDFYSARVWDVLTNAEIVKASTSDFFGLPYGVAHSASGNLTTIIILERGESETVLINVATGEPIAKLPNEELYYLSSQRFALSPNRRLLAGGGGRNASDEHSGHLRVWDIVSNKQLITIDDLPYPAENLVFSPDGKNLIFSESQKVQRINIETGEKNDLFEIPEHTRVSSIAFSPDGTLLAIGISIPGEVQIWDVETNNLLKILKDEDTELPVEDNSNYYVNDVAFNPDGNVIAVAGDSTIRLWDVNTGVSLATLDAGPESIWSISFSPDGMLLAAGSGGVNEGAFETISSDSVIRLYGIANP